MISLTRIKNWYLGNVNRLLLLFIVIVVVSVTTTYIPYLNFLISPTLRILIIFLCVYILFPPPAWYLATVAIGSIFLAFIFTLIQLDFIAETLGDLLYLLLVFIFINYIKYFVRNKKDL